MVWSIFLSLSRIFVLFSKHPSRMLKRAYRFYLPIGYGVPAAIAIGAVVSFPHIRQLFAKFET
jgi:hypothetical protein